eukprot:861-Heterococcus_DN1.PRE.1
MRSPAQVQYIGDPPRLQSAFEFLLANCEHEGDHTLELVLVFVKNGVERKLEFTEYHDGGIWDIGSSTM